MLRRGLASGWKWTVACVVPVLIFHRHVLFDPAYAIPWDMRTFHLPLAAAYADSISEGSFPLWEPYAYCGRPLLANPQAMVLYPGMFAAAAPGRDGLLYRIELLGVLHVALAACLAWLLGRRLGLDALPALLGALMFALGGFPASQTQHLGQLCAMPWLVLAWLALLVSPAWRIPLLALAFGLCLLTGFTAFTVMTTASTLIAALVLRQPLHPVLLAGGLAMVMTAVQLVPSLELTQHSIAKYRWEWLRGGGGIPPGALVSLVWPNYHGVFDPGTFRAPYELTHLYLFSGVTGLALAVLGLRHRGKALGALAIVFGVLMLGEFTPVGRLVFWMLPEMLQCTVYWYVFLAPFLLCLALLAGRGAAAFLRRPAWQFAAVVVVAAECIAISSGRPMNATKTADDPLPGEATMAPIRTLAGGGRLDTVNDAVYLATAAPLLRLRNANGYDPLALERLIQVRLAMVQGQRWGAWYQVQDTRSRVLDLLSVRVLTSRDPLPGETSEAIPGRWARVNHGALPRYRLVYQVTPAESMQQAASQLRRAGFDPVAETIVEGFQLHSPPAHGTVRVLHESRQQVVLETNSSTPAFLVTSEAHFPGWHARLDGAPVPVYYTNIAFRGLPVPAGRHKVEMTFEPLSVRIGVGVSSLGLLGWLALCWRAFRRRIPGESPMLRE
jgi:hypothetical protein